MQRNIFILHFIFSWELEINFKPIKSSVLVQTFAKLPSFFAFYCDHIIVRKFLVMMINDTNRRKILTFYHFSTGQINSEILFSDGL